MSTPTQDSQFWLARADYPNLHMRMVKFVGGAAAITQLNGQPIAVTYIGTGVVEITYPANTNHLGLLGYGFDADTPAQVGGYTANLGAYNATTKKVRCSIYKNNAGVPTLVDLAALQRLTLWLATA